MSTFRLIFFITFALAVALALIFFIFFEVQIIEAEFTILVNNEEVRILEISNSHKIPDYSV